jgi:hypothetical protein
VGQAVQQALVNRYRDGLSIGHYFIDGAHREPPVVLRTWLARANVQGIGRRRDHAPTAMEHIFFFYRNPA